MKNQRTFRLEFKRQVVEELLSGESGAAQLCRRHNIAPSLLSRRKYRQITDEGCAEIFAELKSGEAEKVK